MPGPQDVDAVYAAMQSEALDGVKLADVVGGGDPRAIARMSMDSLKRLGLLQPGTRVLDLGCGCGRLAVQLTQELGPETPYVGIDIIPGLVDFCRREIGARWPNFRFYTVADKNPAYQAFADQGRHLRGLELPDPAALDGAFDLVIASSVFTHLDEEGAREMLGRVRRWLAPGGSALLTFLLLNAHSRRVIDEGQCSIFYDQVAGQRPILNPWANGVVAFDQGLVERLAVEVGFPGLQAVLRGSWSFVASPHYQDHVVLRRDALPPPAFDPARYLALNPDVAAAGMDARLHYELHGRKERRKWY